MAVNPRIKFRVGDLYETREWFWLVFPSQEKVSGHEAVTASAAVVVAAVEVAGVSAYWSERLKCTVSYVEPDSVFMVLRVEGEFVEVLFAETLGWIWVPGWAKKNIRREKAT